MYGRTSGLVKSSALTTGAVAVLPDTGSNTLAHILLLSAIVIGVMAVASQLMVRLYRRLYR